MIVKLVLLMGFFMISLLTFSQKMWEDYKHLMHPGRNYIIYKTISEIDIDGKPDETSWQKTEWSEYFQDIEGDTKPKPLYKTRFKMLWDNQNLYILAQLEEPNVWAYYANRDQIVFHENDFEIFIDPNRDTHDYFEFELNAQNTLFDLFLPKPYRNGGPAKIDWNVSGFKSAIGVDGTINNPADKDKKWTLEIAIPFEALVASGKYYQPEDGQHWKINFSRVQWQTEVVDRKYRKLKDKKTDKYLSEDNWVWSAQGVVNMHFPEKWGLAQFSSNSTGSNSVEFQLPEEEEFGAYLWYVYYKQQSYRRQNGDYASSLSKLDVSKVSTTEEGKTIIYELEVSEAQFLVMLKNENGLKISINQDGLFQVLNKK